MKPGHKRLNKAQLAARRLQVFELLLMGATTRQIGAQLGISHTQVQNDRDVRLKAISDEDPNTEQYRTIEANRLERLLRAMYPLAVGRPAERDDDGLITRPEIDPDPAAVDRVIKIMERRAKLLGLDRPIDVNVEAHQFVDFGWFDDEGDYAAPGNVSVEV